MKIFQWRCNPSIFEFHLFILMTGSEFWGEIFTISASRFQPPSTCSSFFSLRCGGFFFWKSPIHSDKTMRVIFQTLDFLQPTRSPSQNYVLWALESTKKHKNIRCVYEFSGDPQDVSLGICLASQGMSSSFLWSQIHMFISFNWQSLGEDCHFTWENIIVVPDGWLNHHICFFFLDLPPQPVTAGNEG